MYVACMMVHAMGLSGADPARFCKGYIQKGCMTRLSSTGPAKYRHEIPVTFQS
jgi:hypothetical protein